MTAAQSGARAAVGEGHPVGASFQLQDSPQIEETSLTHCESHFVVQQYESYEQMLPAQASQLLVSFTPLAQIECEHDDPPLPLPLPLPPPPPLHDSPQIELTSPTQIESQELLQQ